MEGVVDDLVRTVWEEEMRPVLSICGSAGKVREDLDSVLGSRAMRSYAEVLWLMAALKLDSTASEGLWR
jgi:hypothetical protein